jgi:hypothetical protein
MSGIQDKRRALGRQLAALAEETTGATCPACHQPLTVMLAVKR